MIVPITNLTYGQDLQGDLEMPDIAMCENEKCPKKDKCYRFTATPDPYMQTYSDFKNEDGECKGFWEVEKNE